MGTSKLDEAIAGMEEVALLAKSRVSAYTRKDGTVVKEHDDGRVAKPKADPYGHPNVVGHAEKLQGGAADKAHGFHFAGKQFSASGKEGRSMHDKTPVRHFKEVTPSGDDDGEHVWMDHQGRVHADATSDVGRLRKMHEAHGAKSKPAAAKKKAAKPLHHKDLKEGDELEGPDGEKHEYLSTHRGLGRMVIETRAGHKHPTEKDGTLPGWKKTGRNNA